MPDWPFLRSALLGQFCRVALESDAAAVPEQRAAAQALTLVAAPCHRAYQERNPRAVLNAQLRSPHAQASPKKPSGSKSSLHWRRLSPNRLSLTPSLAIFADQPVGNGRRLYVKLAGVFLLCVGGWTAARPRIFRRS